MQTKVVLAVLLALLGALAGYRIVDLEQRVDALNQRLGAPRPAPAAAAGRQPAADGKPAASATAGYDQRIATLESEVRSLRADLRTLEQATGERPLGADLNPASSPQQILSVVTQEQNRIRDRQLAFHRSRWDEWRSSALESFAKDQHMSDVQTEDVKNLLTKETDRMIEILRRPESLENPAQAAAEWARVLDDTDAVALRVLDPAQRTSWKQARQYERHVFWPWLPKDDETQ